MTLKMFTCNNYRLKRIWSSLVARLLVQFDCAQNVIWSSPIGRIIVLFAMHAFSRWIITAHGNDRNESKSKLDKKSINLINRLIAFRLFTWFRVNNCVSFSNYKYFILFLGYSFSMCLWSAATSFNYFLQFWSNQLPTVGKFNILFLFFVSLMFCISLFSLFSYHIYLVLINRSTLESFSPPIFTYGPNKNAYNLGKYRNFKQVFGCVRLYWFFPIYTR